MTSVLCIDDEQELLDLVSEDLAEMGLSILKASSGKEGLELALSHRPDLILCDVMMPDMDGPRLLAVLREDHPTLDYIPFVFLSALSEKQNCIDGIEMGADDYLTKPVDFEQLELVVKKMLRLSARVRSKAQRDHVKIYKALSQEESKEEDAQQDAAVPPISKSLSGKTAALVGLELGEENYFATIRDAMESANMALETFLSGKEFLETLQEKDFDVVLVYPRTTDLQGHLVFKFMEPLPKCKYGVGVSVYPEDCEFGIALRLSENSNYKRLSVPTTLENVCESLMRWIG